MPARVLIGKCLRTGVDIPDVLPPSVFVLDKALIHLPKDPEYLSLDSEQGPWMRVGVLCLPTCSRVFTRAEVSGK